MSQMCGRDAGIAAECLVWGGPPWARLQRGSGTGSRLADLAKQGCSFLAISLKASRPALHFKRPTESRSEVDNPNAGIPPGSR